MAGKSSDVIFGTGAIGLATLDALRRRSESARLVNAPATPVRWPLVMSLVGKARRAERSGMARSAVAQAAPTRPVSSRTRLPPHSVSVDMATSPTMLGQPRRGHR